MSGPPEGAVWPGGENEVYHAQDRPEPVGKFSGAGDPDGDTSGRDLALRPGQAGRHGGLGDQHRPGDVRRRQPAYQPQRQPQLRFGRERRVTAHEDQAQPFVWYDVLHLVGHPFVHLHLVRCGVRRLDQQRQLRAQRRLPAHDVDGSPFGRGGEPGGRVLGDPGAAPAHQRCRVRLLDALLGQVEVANGTGRRRKYQGPVSTVRLGHRSLDFFRARHGQLCSAQFTGRRSPRPVSATS